MRLKVAAADHVLCSLIVAAACVLLCSMGQTAMAEPGVAVMLVDTNHPLGQIDEHIYGQFLEHINHSVVDGLYAEQICGQGFEGNDFADCWEKITNGGAVELASIKFKQSEKSVRLTATTGTAGIRQKRIYLEAKQKYDGSIWINPEQGALAFTMTFKDAAGKVLAQLPLSTKGAGWQEAKFNFESPATEREASLEITAAGSGSALIDFISLMRADARGNGKLRPDLFDALKQLKPAFIRWPGGSFASIYKWKDGIGPAVDRTFHPNTEWGNSSDYYGFGTDEFMELCRQLGSEPLIVLRATSTDRDQFNDAMDWVHYLLDPATTEWGRKRAANGHAEPYRVPYFQIDNEPMNHNLSVDQYAEIVNLYGKELRKLAPQSKIIACGQKRSNDMNWSQKIIDLAGENFDILGCHNYEYEPDNYATGVRRIEDYLTKVSSYIHDSKHPNIKLAVLEWSLCRTYDWRAGLHAAGSLISYEKLSPALDMSCPALLMRNTTDDPEWRAWIYHDHVSWFPGGGYVAEKLFRDHFAPVRYAVTTGTYKDIPKRSDFFDNISQMKPEKWTDNTVDAIAEGTADKKRIILKAVNYAGSENVLLTRLQGTLPPNAVTVTTIAAGLHDENSLAKPDAIKPTEKTIPFARDLAISLPAYSVTVVEINGN